MLREAAADGTAPGTGASSAVSRWQRQRKPRRRHWPRLQKQCEVMVGEARQAKSNARKGGHRRRRLTSDDVHHLGIKIFLQNKKEGEQKKKMKERCSMSFARQAITGLTTKAESRDGELAGCRQGGGRCLSLRLLSQVGWWAGS